MSIITAKLLPLLFSLLILVVAIISRILAGSWLYPASLFSLLWFAATFFPIVLAPSVSMNPVSMFYILLCVFFFFLSSLLFDWRAAYRENSKKNAEDAYFSTKLTSFIFISVSLLSILFFFTNMAMQGFSLYSLVSDLLNVSSQYIKLRYDGQLVENFFDKACLALTYLSVSIGGLLFGSTERLGSRLSIALIAFIPGFSSMLFQGNKGLIFLLLSLFYAGFLVATLFRGRIQIIDGGLCKVGLLLIAVLVPAVIASFVSRGLHTISDSNYVSDQLSYYFSSYAFGHLYAFSDWFSFYNGYPSEINYQNQSQDITGGFYTFMTFFNAVGLEREIPPGTYDDYYSYRELISTNIYTVFRGAITDFGLLGSLFFMFISGLVINLMFYFLLVSRAPVFSVVFFMFSVGYFYTSFMISLFTWNVIPISMLALALLLYAIRSIGRIKLTRLI